MDNVKELEILNGLLNFEIPNIPDGTRFWMIRTQKGYFYDEFISKRFVALAWNNIDQTTDFSESSKERLKDNIMMEYPEITRPSTVINKCIHFISEVKSGDILVIPSKGSQYITFAQAGEYYEDSSKTVELEKAVIYRIKNNDVDINDVSCPYKKRRHITLLRTMKSEDINYSLYRAISNYHGISNFDAYSTHILNHLYNCYSFKNDLVLVYNVRKETPIRPRELTKMLYGSTDCLSMMIPEENISTQLSLHSPGDIVYVLKEGFEFVRDNWTVFFGMLVFFGGGSVLTFKVPGLIDIIKNIIKAPSEIRQSKSDADLKELEVLTKRAELYEKLSKCGIDPADIIKPIEELHVSSSSMQSEPIILSDDNAVVSTIIETTSEYDDLEE